jgi:membrane protein DedA with SNARE-associated domain
MEYRNIFIATTIGVLILIAFALSLLFALYVKESAVAQEIIQRFGYVGVMVIAFIGGFNLLIPVPISTFSPIFLAAGLSVPGVILSLTLGTSVADFLSYILGRVGRSYSQITQTSLYQKCSKLYIRHKVFVVPAVALYAAFAPYPNEAILLPLGLLGMRPQTLIAPLLLGNLVHNTLFVLGTSTLFDLFMSML